MSGGWVAAGIAAATIASSAYSTQQQKKAQKSAANAQAKASANALNQQQMEFNRLNQNKVDISGILEQQPGSGTSATMLTGAGGVSNDKLTLGGGSSLLGG